MRKIAPYKTAKNALASLDNGGRFYNVLTQANDGDVTSAELAKVTGVFSDMQKMIVDHYDVYEIRNDVSADVFLIAHARGTAKLAPKLTRCGGIIKQLKGGKQQSRHKFFLETLYYTPVCA